VDDPEQLALPEASHSNATGLNNGKMPGPVVARRDQLRELLSDFTGLWHRDPEQYDPAIRCQRRSPSQLAEILIERQ
jgi:hypothetical protein